MKQQKRRCNHPDHEGPRFLPVEEFHRAGYRKGRLNYATRCKKCVNRDNRKKYHEGKRSGGWTIEKKRAYIRARSRAATRITRLYPELYQTIMEEELRKEWEFRDGKSTRST